MRIVVKFGGTSVKNEERINLAAKNLIKLQSAGNEVIAVVSAQGATTSKLVQKASRVGGRQFETRSYAEFLASGEKMSAHLLTMALREKGAEAEAITQDCKKFFLISRIEAGRGGRTSKEKTNELVDISIDEKATRARAKKFVEPLLSKGVIPVVAGFFISDAEGGLVSLGRGGSDITAFLCGKYLNCDEVVIVTDVNGVLSSDPRVVEKARLLQEVTAADLALLSRAGAQVIHPNALRFKTENCKAKIAHYKDLHKLAETGTRVTGAVGSKVSAHPRPLSLLTFMGKKLAEKSGVAAPVFAWMENKGKTIHALSASDNFLSLYMNGELQSSLLNELHEEFVEGRGLFESLSTVKNIGEITLSNHIFLQSPGVISAISDALTKAGVNIIEMVTAHTDIVVYVKSADMDKSLKVLKERFGKNGK